MEKKEKDILIELREHYNKGLVSALVGAGFSKNSLVMKRARGYKDIFKNWVEFSCGYELEEGTPSWRLKTFLNFMKCCASSRLRALSKTSWAI